MTGLRWLKGVTVCGVLILITTAWAFKCDLHGYNQTLASLRASFGDSASIFIAIFSVASLVSMPFVGIAGAIGMIGSRRLGRSAFVLGFLCVVLSAANFVLWKKYGGVPAKGGATGPTPVTHQASQNPPQRRRANAP